MLILAVKNLACLVCFLDRDLSRAAEDPAGDSAQGHQ